MSRSAAHDARNEAFRSGLGSPDARKEARIPTADVVPAECQRLGIQVKAEEVPDSDGAVIHWIGDSSLENVMLYFHGTDALFYQLHLRLLSPSLSVCFTGDPY